MLYRSCRPTHVGNDRLGKEQVLKA
jgi:hypothetical protein